MKISLITVTWNAQDFLQACIDSVAGQTYKNLEYIIIDGASTDKTLNIIDRNKALVSKFISGKDNGIYDAMNKGIALAEGDVIGILNADDQFAYPDALSDIAATFNRTGADIVYSDLNYVDRMNVSKILRKWVSSPYSFGMFAKGWMPAHPTFYAKRELFEEKGLYDLSMGSAADYELMLRFMNNRSDKASYLNKVTVLMRTGGVSNRSFSNRIKASIMDFKAMRKNKLSNPVLALILKPLSKISQYF